MTNELERTSGVKSRGISGVIGSHPGRFWIGCSDSPADLFELAKEQNALIHSNPGNLALPSDLSLLATLKMAIDLYNVSEIVICGHYGCRSVEAASEGIRNEIIGDWLSPLKTLAVKSPALRTASGGTHSTVDTLAEQNVVLQVMNVSRTSIVRDAWASGKSISILGMIFEPTSGRLKLVSEPITSAFLG